MCFILLVETRHCECKNERIIPPPYWEMKIARTWISTEALLWKNHLGFFFSLFIQLLETRFHRTARLKSTACLVCLKLRPCSCACLWNVGLYQHDPPCPALRPNSVNTKPLITIISVTFSLNPIALQRCWPQENPMIFVSF